MKVNNSGKDPFPLLLRKSKLPKKPVFTYCPVIFKKLIFIFLFNLGTRC